MERHRQRFSDLTFSLAGASSPMAVRAACLDAERLFRVCDTGKEPAMSP